MEDYLAMKYYLEKNNLHYFTFSPNSEKPMKVVIYQLPQDTPVEYVCNSLEDLGCNIINVRQMIAIRIAPKDKPTWNPSLDPLLP
jgi:hypothetical protein